MPDTDISDLWWLKPGAGTDQSIGRQFLQGMQVGAEIRHQRAMEEIQRGQLASEIAQRQSLADIRKAQLQTDEIKAVGLGEINSYISEVAARKAWDDPQAESGFWKLLAKYPQVIPHNEGLNIFKSTFLDSRASAEKAREADARLDYLRKADENRAAARFAEIEVRQQRADSYAQRVASTKEYQEGVLALREAQSETDLDIKKRKTAVAEGLLDVARQKADTAEALGTKRAEFLDARIKQMELGLAPGLATAFHARAVAIRDKWQYSADPKAMEKAEEEIKMLEQEYGVKKPARTSPIGPPAPPANAKDPLGLFK